MSWLVSNKSAGAPKSGIVTVLDVGSSKVCCIIARLVPRAPLRNGLPHVEHPPQRMGDAVEGVEARVQAVMRVLEHDLDVAPHGVRMEVTGRNAADILPVEQDGALGA